MGTGRGRHPSRARLRWPRAALLRDVRPVTLLEPPRPATASGLRSGPTSQPVILTNRKSERRSHAAILAAMLTVYSAL
jgi:hypothetical protein